MFYGKINTHEDILGAQVHWRHCRACCFFVNVRVYWNLLASATASFMVAEMGSDFKNKDHFGSIIRQ